MNESSHYLVSKDIWYFLFSYSLFFFIKSLVVVVFWICRSPCKYIDVMIALFLDRYVIVGGHRDAWIFGAVDPSSGTSVIMETARLLGELRKKGQSKTNFSAFWFSHRTCNAIYI